MDAKTKWKYGIITILIAVIIMVFLNFGLKLEADKLEIIGGGLVVMIPSVLGFMNSNKTNTKIDSLAKNVSKLSDDQNLMKVAIKDIDESFKHRKEITNLCQKIENETSEIFESYSEINVMLKDYIIGVNDSISEIIDKQYSYDFDLFDAKYFKTKILNKVMQITEHVNYVMLDKEIFEKVSDKVIVNIKTYITELKYIKDLENGKRRKEFKELTLSLTKRITNHSIDIYKNFKQTA